MDVQSQNVTRRALLGAGAIAALTVTAYFPALTGEFILDDHLYVTGNPLIRASDGLLGIWLTRSFQDYYALTHTSFWLEWRLWGETTAGYHAVNLALHIVNAWLVWRLLGRLGVPGAFAAALLFALHPVNVQAVAWISQRKTLLAATFFFTSLLAYLNFDDGGRRRLEWYTATLGSFLLALLSKISAAVLPALIPLVIWWRRGALRVRDLWPVLPILLLAALFGANGLDYENLNPVSRPDARMDSSFLGRTADAGRALGFYAGKAIWPHPLSFLYPHWNAAGGAGARTGYAILGGFSALVCVLCWARDRWGRGAFAALVWFGIGLAPVLGYLDFGHLRFSPVADHYQYLSLVAVCGFAAGVGTRAPRPAALLALTGVTLVALGLTHQQAALYIDRETIYLDTLAKNPGSWRAHNNLGSYYYSVGQFEQAAEYYATAVLRGGDVNTHANLGLARLALGDPSGALVKYANALEIDPNHADSHLGLGNVRLAQGQLAQAEVHFEEALQRNPSLTEAHAHLAALRQGAGDIEGAIQHFEAALGLEPGLAAEVQALANAHSELGVTLAERGEIDAAIEHFREAARLVPDQAPKFGNLGIALATRGDLEEASKAWEHALEIDPGYAPAQLELQKLRAQRRAPRAP